jgi:hypothetical protein
VECDGPAKWNLLLSIDGRRNVANAEGRFTAVKIQEHKIQEPNKTKGQLPKATVGVSSGTQRATEKGKS